MFGAFFTAIVLTGGVISYCKTKSIDNQLDRENKINAIKDYNNGKNISRTYVKSTGHGLGIFDLDTDLPVEFRKDKNTGHDLVYISRDNRRTWVFARDITEEKIKRSVANEKVCGFKTTVKGRLSPVANRGLSEFTSSNYIIGNRFIDINTASEYVVRSVIISSGEKISPSNYTLNGKRYWKETYLYLNTKTGMFVRRTDNQIINDNNGFEYTNAIPINETEDFIKKINNIQQNKKRVLNSMHASEIQKDFWYNPPIIGVNVFDSYYINGVYDGDCKILTR